jgi:putative membrane protein
MEENMRYFIALAASALTVSAIPAVSVAATQAADLTPEQRRPYVRMAAASDLFEIQSSQIAMQKARRAETRAFAQMLTRHHRQTTRQLTQAARTAGVAVPAPTLMPMQAQMIRELRRANGRNFDRLFFQQQVTAHEMALNLHQNYASAGDAPALKRTARAAVPIIQQHLDRARQSD